MIFESGKPGSGNMTEPIENPIQNGLPDEVEKCAEESSVPVDEVEAIERVDEQP